MVTGMRRVEKTIHPVRGCADHGAETPTAPIVVSVADEGTIEFQLYLTQEA
jgi:hypothetical protein